MKSERNKQRPKGERTRSHRPSSLPARKTATVLIVDDDPSALPALSRLVRAAGFRVRAFDRPSALLTASDVPKARACMIVDLYLPEMNGIELCRLLTESGRGLPAVLITGRNDAETKLLMEQAHPVAMLFKPIDERALMEALDRALAAAEQEQGHR